MPVLTGPPRPEPANGHLRRADHRQFGPVSRAVLGALIALVLTAAMICW